MKVFKDKPHPFDAFVIDLSPLKTETEVRVDKTELLDCFEELISVKGEAAEELHKMITSTTNRAYRKGI